MIGSVLPREVPARSLRMLHARLAASGQDAQAWLAGLGVAAPQLLDPGARVTRETYLAAWRRAEALARDPAFGVRLVDLLPLHALVDLDHETEYLLVQLAATSATVGEALARAARYHALVGPELVLERAGADATVRLPPADLPRALVEFSLALIVRMLQVTASGPVAIAAVQLAAPAPADPGEHARVLGPVRFGAADDAVIVRGEALAVPLRSARAELGARLAAHAEAQLQASAAASFATTVATIVAARLAEGRAPAAGAIARALGVSSRTLARRLGAEGTSHRAVLDQVRAALSERYLTAGDLAVKDVADRLGFADASAFHRAYRRWFGRAPTARARPGA